MIDIQIQDLIQHLAQQNVWAAALIGLVWYLIRSGAVRIPYVSPAPEPAVAAARAKVLELTAAGRKDAQAAVAKAIGKTE